MILWLLAATTVLPRDAVPAPGGNVIEVTVSGIRTDQGRIHVDICPEADFLKACPYSAEVPAKAGTVNVMLKGVPPGRYAVQAFQDANANGEVDRGMFGIPKEGIGFSNDAMAKLQRPKFTVAAFDHGTASQQIEVLLRYHLG